MTKQLLNNNFAYVVFNDMGETKVGFQFALARKQILVQLWLLRYALFGSFRRRING
jgi:hypothetical protein